MDPKKSKSCCQLLLALIVAGFAGCGPLPAKTSGQSKTIVFNGGEVEFQVPRQFLKTDEPDDTLAISPSANDDGIVLRLNLHSLDESEVSTNQGYEFVEAQASQKGLEATEQDGKILFKETSSFQEGGRSYDMTFWQIGFENQVVVLSAEVEQGRRSDQAVIDCVIAIPEMIQSLKKRN